VSRVILGTPGSGKTRLSRTVIGPAEPSEQVDALHPSVYDSFRADRKAVQIPYSQSEWATLQAGFPLTESQWHALISMLQAMKPGLVQEQSEAPATSAEISDH
jgi:adenylate kinase family enzyme